MPDVNDSLLLGAWSALLTAFGGLVSWNLKRMADKVDGMDEKVDSKVDRSEVDRLRDDIDSWIKRQEEQHRENTRRLDRIIDNQQKLQRDRGY